MKTAAEKLQKAARILEDRGKERDLPDGERSMERAIGAFNALTGARLTEADGWLFMICLKASRSLAGTYKEDDYDDLIGYAALRAEAADAGNDTMDEGATSFSAVLAPFAGWPLQDMPTAELDCLFALTAEIATNAALPLEERRSAHELHIKIAAEKTERRLREEGSSHAT